MFYDYENDDNYCKIHAESLVPVPDHKIAPSDNRPHKQLQNQQSIQKPRQLFTSNSSNQQLKSTSLSPPRLPTPIKELAQVTSVKWISKIHKIKLMFHYTQVIFLLIMHKHSL